MNPCQIDLKKARENRKNITLIYLHGGGLVFGDREDFPILYQELFLKSGYDFLGINYPLAPEASLDEIMKEISQSILFFFHKYKSLGLISNDYLILGRSSGSFLSFQSIAQHLAEKPKAFISMYGYDSLEYPILKKPNSHYLKYPLVDKRILETLNLSQKIYGSTTEDRFLIYLYLRQQGLWSTTIEGSQKYPPLSLETLQSFPYTILVSSVYDPDVNYEISKNLSRKIPKKKMITLYEEEHDFDRDTKKETGFKIYKKIIALLEDYFIKEEIS